ncbi:hypothetical protein [Chryseobacterium wanjuense]
MKKNIYFILLLFGIFQKILAQVGIATATVSDGVMLELGTNNKGILLPRIALTSKKSSAPLPANVPSGTMVYNTATVGTFPNLVAPGIYWWSSEDTQWIQPGYQSGHRNHEIHQCCKQHKLQLNQLAKSEALRQYGH